MFSDFGVAIEPEFIDFEDDICYYTDGHGNVYKLDFKIKSEVKSPRFFYLALYSLFAATFLAYFIIRVCSDELIRPIFTPLTST